ncbi:hypothetical protein [Rhodovulum kholense]|nr:hypothetical protein [Rhodovulum kholense]
MRHVPGVNSAEDLQAVTDRARDHAARLARALRGLAARLAA